ncbi:hypothetical protein JSE7799_00731 [Jannaschia seosinensis]|uniref:Uncharacterized protein n=1 Tax=Jannaschia seosinensis TaxID=313367 RepID=A0A0M7B9U0_9RHOB|nr:hypothetical protein JSE7799_00731 [Jannaschia seosinensis]
MSSNVCLDSYRPRKDTHSVTRTIVFQPIFQGTDVAPTAWADAAFGDNNASGRDRRFDQCGGGSGGGGVALGLLALRNSLVRVASGSSFCP